MDVATLAIKVENGDVVKATTSLDSMAVAGGKTEAATQRLTRRMALLEIEARNMDAELGRGGRAMVAMEIEARKLDAELEREARAMALVEIEARKMDAAMTASKQAAYAAEIRKTTAATEALEAAARKADSQMEKTGRSGAVSFSALKSAVAALGIGVAIREFSQLSDTYTNMHSRLALVTTGTGNLAAVQRELFDISQRTRTSFEGTADLYSKIARNAAQLGVSQRDVLTVTETVSKAMIISGGSAESNRAAIVQLGQALASGTLRGDELNSVMEQAPRLAQAVADGLGVTTGQLRQMGKDGKLTSEEVVRALLKMRDTIDKEFTQLPTTIGGAWQLLRNEILNTVGAANEAGGMSGGIVTAINAIREAIPPAFKAVNQFFGGFAIGSADAAISLEKVRQKSAEIQLAIGQTMRARGLPGGQFLMENAAKVLKDGDDILRMLEKQRDEVIKNVHAITEAGKVSDDRPHPSSTPKVDPNAAKDLKALQDATDAYYNSLNQHQIDAVKAIGTTREHNAATREMIEAVKAGPAAVDALTVAQAGADAVRALGVGVSEKLAASVRKEAEEQARLAIELGQVKEARTKAESDAKKSSDEQIRDAERQAREVRRATVSNIEGILTDLSNGRNPLIALAEGFKRAMIRAISEALAEKFLASKFAEMLGIGGPSGKQEKAGVIMNVAADKQLEAARLMAGVPSTRPGAANSTTARSGAQMPDWMQKLKTVAEFAAVAYGGYQAGQSAGASVYSQNRGKAGNYVLGALSGAASGALAGAALGSVFGPVGTAAGAVIGGLAGFVGGIIGVHKASKEAAEATKQLRVALEQSMQSLRNRVNHNELDEAIRQVNEERKKAAQQIEDAYAYGDKNSANVRERNRLLAEMNALEDKYIAQLREEAAAKDRYFTEDLDVRALRAQGKTGDADRLDLQYRQQRELDEYRRTHDMGNKEYADQYAYLQQVQALERNTKAINALTTSVRNGPAGFKVEPYIQQFAKAMPRGPYPSSPFSPSNPFLPPMSPLSPPMLSRTGRVASAPVTINVTVNESKSPKLTAQEVTRMVASELDKGKGTTSGMNSSRASALELV